MHDVELERAESARVKEGDLGSLERWNQNRGSSRRASQFLLKP